MVLQRMWSFSYAVPEFILDIKKYVSAFNTSLRCHQHVYLLYLEKCLNSVTASDLRSPSSCVSAGAVHLTCFSASLGCLC